MTIKTVLLCGLTVFAIDSRAQVFSETFANFPGIEQTYLMSGLLPANCIGADPKNLTWVTPPAPLDKWGMLITLPYSQTWQGPGPTQSWAVSGNQMNIHSSGNGFAFISGKTFDKTTFIEAEADLRLYAQNNAAGGFAGVALEGSEADYREISYRTQSDGTIVLKRNAPCDEAYLTNALGQNIVVSSATPHRLRIEYRGPDGGSWRYFIDGVPTYLSQNGALLQTEAGTYLSASLANAPRLGLYWVPPQPATATSPYVEGSQANIQVYQLSQVQPVGASASATYGSFYPTNAIDSNLDTEWISGGFAPQWIEIDLGQATPIRKIRLLTLQTPVSGQTSHSIYAGMAPSPTQLVQTISGTTTDGQWLEVDTLDAPVVARYVRVLTTASNSWVGWREIQVFQ